MLILLLPYLTSALELRDVRITHLQNSSLQLEYSLFLLIPGSPDFSLNLNTLAEEYEEISKYRCPEKRG